MKNLIRCGFGIGNRVATLANALSRHAEIQFSWKLNEHLPLEHWEVFPRGIPGVEFVDAPVGSATRWGKNMPGQSWAAAHDRGRADDAYRRIMEAMVGGTSDPVEVSIMVRFFRWPDTSPGGLAETAARHGGRAFVMADSRREELAEALAQVGVETILPDSLELTQDMDRSPESVMQYISDWKRALSARIIVTTRGQSSSIFPALAAGKTIIFH